MPTQYIHIAPRWTVMEYFTNTIIARDVTEQEAITALTEAEQANPEGAHVARADGEYWVANAPKV